MIKTLDAANVKVHPYEDIANVLQTMAAMASNNNVWLDPQSANWHLKATCTSLGFKVQSDCPLPIALSKSIKNPTELATIKEAHVVDGVALSKYLCWLEMEMSQATFQLDEVEAADRLESFRKETSASFIGNSFSTISSSGQKDNQRDIIFK